MRLYCNQCGTNFPTMVLKQRFCSIKCGSLFTKINSGGRVTYFKNRYHKITKKNPVKMARRRERTKIYQQNRRKLTKNG